MSKNLESVDKRHDAALSAFIDIEENTLSLKTIESIARDDEVRQRFEKKFPDNLHATILLSLTHKHFNESKAHRLWLAILEHRTTLSQQLKRDISLTLATLDYLTHITPVLSNPKLIEETRSRYIAQATTHDQLTGLYLREVFDTFLNKQLAEAKRHQTPLSLLMLDIDDFKQINDTYGHQTGDQVLRQMGDILNREVREMDLAARYGGEELAIVMPDTLLKQGVEAAERIRTCIENFNFGDFSITVSIGVCHSLEQYQSFEGIIKGADDALYTAKHEGKNCVRPCASSSQQA